MPEQALAALRLSPAEMTSELRLAAAKLFEPGRLSSGVAAELAGLTRVVFLSRLADYGVATFRLSEEELRKNSSVAETICDTSPIQYLHQSGVLELLRLLYGRVTAPAAAKR